MLSLAVAFAAISGCHRANPLFTGRNGATPTSDAAAAFPPDAGPANIRDANPTPPPDAGPGDIRDANPTPPGSSSLDLDLIGHWALDDGSGSGTALDSSPNANAGVLRDMDATTSWTPGHFGTGLRFERKGWVQIPPSTSINSIRNAYTMAAWINPADSSVKFGTILARQIGASSGEYYALFVTPAGLIVVFNNAGFLARQLPRGVWVHVAATYDGTVGRIFVGGVEDRVVTLGGTTTADTTAFTIGGNIDDNSDTASNNFDGIIDEVLLYRRALPPADIARLAAGERPH